MPIGKAITFSFTFYPPFLFRLISPLLGCGKCKHYLFFSILFWWCINKDTRNEWIENNPSTIELPNAST
jgi:hypothetical protein